MLFLPMLAAPPGGEADKFTRVYERYHRALYGVALSILKEQAAAEDAVQNAFLRVLKNLDKIEEEDCSKTRAFLIVIVRRECFKIYNQRRESGAVPFEDYLASEEAGEGLCAREDWTVSDVGEAMRRLPEVDQALLVGKYAHGYSYRELAVLLDLSESNVSVRIVRAKRRVMELLEESEVRPGGR